MSLTDVINSLCSKYSISFEELLDIVARCDADPDAMRAALELRLHEKSQVH